MLLTVAVALQGRLSACHRQDFPYKVCERSAYTPSPKIRTKSFVYGKNRNNSRTFRARECVNDLPTLIQSAASEDRDERTKYFTLDEN